MPCIFDGSEVNTVRTFGAIFWLLCVAFAWASFRALVAKRNSMIRGLCVQSLPGAEVRLLGIALQQDEEFMRSGESVKHYSFASRNYGTEDDDQSFGRDRNYDTMTVATSVLSGTGTEPRRSMGRKASVKPPTGPPTVRSPVRAGAPSTALSLGPLSATTAPQQERPRSTPRRTSSPAARWRIPIISDAQVQYYMLSCAMSIAYGGMVLALVLFTKVSCDSGLVDVMSTVPAVLLYVSVAQLLYVVALMHASMTRSHFGVARYFVLAVTLLRVMVWLFCAALSITTCACIGRGCESYAEALSCGVAAVLCLSCALATVGVEGHIRIATGLMSVALLAKTVLIFPQMQHQIGDRLTEAEFILLWGYSSLGLVSLAFAMLHRQH